jgi:hypothetical protein
MKQTIFLILFIGLFSCEKNENGQDALINNGMYQGRIKYLDTFYYSQISFEDKSYEENALGGVLIQKLPTCLTGGTYAIKSDSITFTVTSNKTEDAPCISELELTGTYKILMDADSITFWRYFGNEKIEYNLRRLVPLFD